jgi:hypothetical protein
MSVEGKAYDVGDGKRGKEGERRLEVRICNCVEDVGFGSFRTLEGEISSQRYRSG